MCRLAGTGPGDIVYDLGCGDGRVVISAALDGAYGVGIDIDPQRILEASANAREAGVSSRTSFWVGDLHKVDVSEATVVMLFLLPWTNLDLRPRLWRTLRPGTRVVSHHHTMGDWEPVSRVEADGRVIRMWVITEYDNQRAAG